MKDGGTKKIIRIVNRLVNAACTVAAALVVSTMTAVLVASCFRAEAETNEPTVVETLLSDGTTNLWTQADLVVALGLLNRRYHRDVETEKGRVAWHGKVVRREVVTNGTNIIMRNTYEDGFTHDEEGRSPRPVTPKVRTIPAYMTNNVPARLAAARVAAFKNVEIVTTNITMTVGDTLIRPHRVVQYDDYGVVTNVFADGTIEREFTPSGVVTRTIKSNGKVSAQKFVPGTK